MQTVTWSSQLSFLAQCGGFFRRVRDIFNRSRRYRFFYAESWTEPPPLKHVNLRLLDRDDIRSSSFRVSGFGAESFSTEHDEVYNGRDSWRDNRQVRDVFGITRAIHGEYMEPPSALPTDLEAWLWAQLSDTATIRGQHQLLEENQLTYDAQWFTNTSFLRKNWLVLHRASRDGLCRVRKTNIALWLSAMAYAGKVQQCLLHLMVGMAFCPQLRNIPLPEGDEFFPGVGIKPVEGVILSSACSHLVPFQRSPEQKLPRPPQEAKVSFKLRRERAYRENGEAAVKTFVTAMVTQWPCASLQVPLESETFKGCYSYIDVPKAMTSANAHFKQWFDNRSFVEYLSRVNRIAPRAIVPLNIADLSLSKSLASSRRDKVLVNTDTIFSRDAPRLPGVDCLISRRSSLTKQLLNSSSLTEEASLRLNDLIRSLQGRAFSRFEKEYVAQLQYSLEALREYRRRTTSHSIARQDLHSILRQYHAECTQTVATLYRAIVQALYGTSLQQSTSARLEDIPVPNIYQWPRICPTFILSQLCAKRWRVLSPGWRSCLIQYGISLTHLNQATRLLGLTYNELKFIQEAENIGHTNWNPEEDPESLLFEVEGDMTIRGVQAQIASEMRSPRSGRNTTMQLNMGEGKSSVIIPMVAASVADQSLPRVIVAKSQAGQMSEMLVSRLGGLVNRPVIQAPFSRAVKTGPAEVKLIHSLYQDCAEQGGILLVQPEHIVSFKLMGIERACAGESETCRLLLESQKLLTECCRDIVDESDENFSPNFELIYTAGTQRPIDHSPTRWCCVQEILGIFRDCLPPVRDQFATSIETWQDVQGSFPRTRILQTDAWEAIADKIVETICGIGLIGFPIVGKSKAYKDTVREYITTKKLSKDQIEAVEQGREWTEAEMRTLLLLRGLFAGGVLLFAFSRKRWRVDYGLAFDRVPTTKLAVPFRAKDNPSPRSEFSHPDVVILLTLLSYYYRGLSDDELMLAFCYLSNSDQASLVYQEWVKDAHALPRAFCQLEGVDLDNHPQCKNELFPYLRKAKSAVDYYVAHVVFPKEMREFPFKLSASGWDLAEAKHFITTGFSGTNDSRIVLPLSMEQIDLESQKHTNALVLEHLLQPENHVAPMLTSRQDGESDADRLLSMVVSMDMEIRVILDVGAQILELNNKQVAERWLEYFPDDNKTQAAVFFDDDDKLCVLDRRGNVDLLHVSPFATRLDVCLIFLDEGHTRGTDLKLPQDYRAAVTLGARLTKDRLVQGKNTLPRQLQRFSLSLVTCR